MNKYHITKKNYISRILISFFASVMIFFFYFAVFFLTEEDVEGFREQPFIIELGLFLIPLIIFIFLSIYSWFLMRKYVFYDDSKNLVIEKGIFYKTQIKIPYEKISTIAIKRSLLDLIITTSKVEIDTGTTASPLPEGKLMVSKNYALILKDFLENKKDNYNLELPNPNLNSVIEEKEENIVYQAKPSTLFKLGILKQGFLGTAVTLLLIQVAFMNIMYYFGDEVTEELSSIILGSTLFSLMMLVLVALIFGLGNMFMYYGYKLIIKDDTIEYQYGFFSKTNFKVKMDKINALYLKQSIGYKLFGYYSLDASIIGIADGVQNSNNNQNKTESRYILPIAKKEVVTEVLKLLNAEELINDEYIKPTRFRLFNFIYLPLILITIPLITLLIIFFNEALKFYIVTITTLVAYVLLIIALKLRLKNHGYNVGSNILLRKGSFTVSKVLIRKQRIQNITYLQGPISLMLNIGNIELRYKRLLGRVVLKGYTSDEFLKVKNDIF